MSDAKAYLVGSPVLESKPLSTLCANFVKGYCQLAEGCPQRHTHLVHLIDGTSTNKPVTVGNLPNVLSLEPRKSPSDNKIYFDNDGPGVLSSAQMPRHDNDHVLIQDIRILPTTDEILCLKRPYMPTKFIDQAAHHLSPGPLRHLDIAFRQLRYDNTEPIVDLTYHAMQQLYNAQGNTPILDYQFGLETPNGNRYSLFRNVAFESLDFHESKGAMIRVSFDCPKALQGRKIHSCGVLEDGMMCALIGLHDGTKELTTTFLQVHLRESTEGMKSRTGNHTRAAVQLSFADRDDIDSVRRCTYYMVGLIKGSFVLADLPNVLLNGFALHLDRLQKLADNPNFAFASQIAPATPPENQSIPAPAYATKPGFKFNLTSLQSTIKGRDIFEMRPIQSDFVGSEIQTTLDALKTKTSLDQGQAVALYENLSRSLAMTQGPPGTGKTFLGVSLAQVILDSQNKSDKKPILVASQTNRACDDFLSDLLKKGIKIVRLGGGSKEEWTKPYLLREQTNKMRLTTFEGKDLKEVRTQLDYLSRDALGWAESLSKDMLGWHSLKDHLKTYYPAVFDHFSRLEEFDGEVTEVKLLKRYSGFAYEFWASGGDINDVNALLKVLDTVLGECQLRNESAAASADFKQKVIADVKRNTETATSLGNGQDLWSLSISERHKIIAGWLDELNAWKVCEGFAEVHRRHQAAFQRKRAVMRSIDARCLLQQQVIGMTTTGVAYHWELLNELNLRTLITEEASECLEAHTLCALFNSIQHAIFIGDPLQLRPLVTTPTLSTEHCPKYRLDESLFERMMFEGLPVSKLSVQRRMHPEIADLSRAGDYEYLIDHDSTTFHPPVAGMVDRTYWFDHHQPEDRPDPRSPMWKSHSNRFEVEFCASLVRYLIERNGYKFGEIVILTPYNGQLAALTTRLAERCEILLTDRDREALQEMDIVPAAVLGPKSSKVALDLSNMLRIVTVDNYQGEEAKIIIFSAVRSNGRGTVGFLSSRNRINVACSRARDGFYILGNASLMGSVEHWAKRIEVFKQKNVIGKNFRASCPRHPERIYEIHEPEQFENIPPCSIPCPQILACGHSCNETCHPLEMHDDGRMPCTAACGEILTCGHLCPRKCSEPCGGCDVESPAMRLPCGHLHTPICSETVRGRMFICKQVRERVELPCGHTKEVICSKADQAEICDQKCGAILPCGHSCIQNCETCKENGGHSKCRNVCGANVGCSHTCNYFCHPGDCPPCNQKCPKSCQHGSCELPCSVVCDPCTKPCGRGGCAHREPCSMVCSLPCDRLPCNEPCLNLLSCGVHICPGLCSESCMPHCTQCKTGVFPDQHQIYLSCGHTLTAKKLDSILELNDLYQVDADYEIKAGGVAKLPLSGSSRCPDCWQAIQGVNRYELANQLQDMLSTIDRYYAKLGRKLATAVADMFRSEEFLRRTWGKFCEGLKPGPLGGKTNQRLIWDRSQRMLEIQQQIMKLRDEIVLPFEKNLDRLTAFIKNPDILGNVVPTFGFRYALAYYLCRLVTLEDGLKVFKHLQSMKDLDHHTLLIVEGLRIKIADHALAEMKSLEERIVECRALHLKRIEVEMSTVQVGLCEILTDLQADSQMDAMQIVKSIRKVCVAYPDTAGQLSSAVQRLKQSIDGLGCVPAFLSIYDQAARQLTVKLGKYQVGDFKVCHLGHPFSGLDWKECPECGREVGPEPDHEKLLCSAEDFMSKACAASVSGRFAQNLMSYRMK